MPSSPIDIMISFLNESKLSFKENTAAFCENPHGPRGCLFGGRLTYYFDTSVISCHFNSTLSNYWFCQKHSDSMERDITLIQEQVSSLQWWNFIIIRQGDKNVPEYIWGADGDTAAVPLRGLMPQHWRREGWASPRWRTDTVPLLGA